MMKQLASISLAWFSVGAASTAIFGHFTNNLRLASWFDGATPMAVSSAVVFVAIAGAFMLHDHHRPGGGRHD